MKKPAASRIPKSPEEESGLTSIHRRIHCAATQDSNDNDELDKIANDNFLRTIADVALAVGLDGGAAGSGVPVQATLSARNDKNRIVRNRWL